MNPRDLLDHDLEPLASDADLDDACPPAGSYQPSDEPAAEEITACLERWLTARADREVQP